MLPITDVAHKLDLRGDDLWHYGPQLAKLSWETVERLKGSPQRGKLILVSAMTPTKYGEGKTTTTIGLTQGLVRRGVRAMAALREPSLGPVLGAKGGGTGGGLASLQPSTRINLHATGDLHAIAAANNLLAALIDNALYFEPQRLQRVTWKRCIDINDRFLRHTVIGLGGRSNGLPREDGFDITAASEVMATLCMADDAADLKRRLGRLVVGTDAQQRPVTAADLRADGAMAALLADAVLPNLAQTSEGAPALFHGGPFANIAHGCNSVIATKTALALADVVVTEAGFAFDLGGEKFLDLKCRQTGLWPSAVVLVATVRALRCHGGDTADFASIERGFANLRRHVAAVRGFGLTPVVALNVFADDAEADLAGVERLLQAEDIASARCEGFAKGGAGAETLTDLVLQVAAADRSDPQFTYALSDAFEAKMTAIATRVYGARDVVLTASAQRDLQRLQAWGMSELPVCMAKTHLSLSDDPLLQGAPTDFTVTVREVRASAGAGFLLALTGDLLTMPGLPREPASWQLDLRPDGVVVGVQ